MSMNYIYDLHFLHYLLKHWHFYEKVIYFCFFWHPLYFSWGSGPCVPQVIRISPIPKTLWSNMSFLWANVTQYWHTMLSEIVNDDDLYNKHCHVVWAVWLYSWHCWSEEALPVPFHLQCLRMFPWPRQLRHVMICLEPCTCGVVLLGVRVILSSESL